MKSKKQKWTGTLPFTTLSGVKALIKVSKGSNADLANLAARFTNTGALKDLAQLDLISGFPAGYYDGADVKISVVGEGTGRVNVGLIFAQKGAKPAINLGTVEIEGDLGRILIGTGSSSVPALKVLKVNSLGLQLGPSNQYPTSEVTGGMHKLIVRGDIQNSEFEVSTDLKEVKIGGSLIGGFGGSSGMIVCGGDIGVVSIDGNLIGGDGNSSGSIFAKGDIGKIKVGGIRQPGNGADSGIIKPHA